MQCRMQLVVEDIDLCGSSDEEEGAEEAEQEGDEEDVGEVSVVGLDDGCVAVLSEGGQH